MTIDQMNDLEAIRQLKARYFRLMDTQQWEAWADCFTSDVSASYEGAPRANPQVAHRCQFGRARRTPQRCPRVADGREIDSSGLHARD